MQEKSSVFTEYPRPQLRRESFFNLNGKWLANESEIIVPFPPESKASEYNGKLCVTYEYKKDFELPDDFVTALKNQNQKNRAILHFGAVDQKATVFVNDIFVGSHLGGYLPFSFDITDYLENYSEKQKITLVAEDNLNHFFPYGKQKKNRGGMWYTPVSGIWQTVWMEIVPEIYISKIKILPDTKGFNLFVETTDTTECKNDELPLAKSDAANKNDFYFRVLIKGKSGKTYTFDFSKTDFRIDLIDSSLQTKDDFELWTCENPNLYDFSVSLFLSKEDLEKQNAKDKIESYFGLREISILEIEGKNRICLNKKPVFLHGVLDQGYFVDGIYLPKSEEGFRKDIQNMKSLGINTLRKHIKIEPEIFYYECDKEGMLVMQDMVNNGSYNFIRDTAIPTVFSKKGLRYHLKDKEPKSKLKQFFLEHSKQTIQHLHNHPCVVYYTIFNEGWGQFNANYAYKVLKQVDSSRIYDTASGWFKNPKSDVESDHIYFKTPSLIDRAKKCKKPLIISECGGYTLAVKNHLWNPKAKYGYGSCNSSQELTQKIVEMYQKMIIPAVKDGICGCVYTQLSDVEDEINGFFTYDREICKVEKEKIKEIAAIFSSLMQNFLL